MHPNDIMIRFWVGNGPPRMVDNEAHGSPNNDCVELIVDSLKQQVCSGCFRDFAAKRGSQWIEKFCGTRDFLGPQWHKL